VRYWYLDWALPRRIIWLLGRFRVGWNETGFYVTAVAQPPASCLARLADFGI
jgi:hypothetical protein